MSEQIDERMTMLSFLVLSKSFLVTFLIRHLHLYSYSKWF
jgi:hypothetical protein